MANAKRIFLQSVPWQLLDRVALVGGNTLNGSGLKHGVVFQAQDTDTITHVFFSHHSTVGTSPTYKIGIQGVGTTGNPDGTYLGGGSPASATVNPTSLGYAASTGYWVALTNSISLTRGQFYSFVIEYDSGTINGSNFSRVGVQQNENSYIPYWLAFNGTSWGKQTAWAPVYGLRSATNVYGRPFSNSTANQISTNGHRSAAKFSLDAGWLSSYKLSGFALIVSDFSATGNITVGLWSASSSIQTFSFDTDYIAGTGTGGYREFYFTGDPVVLDAGTAYYVGFERNGTSFFTNTLQLSEANDAKAYPLGGFNLSTWNGSAWTDSPSILVPCRLIFDDLTGGGGGGGLILPRAMNGGVL